MRTAIQQMGTKLAPPVNSVPNFVEPPANDDFGPVIRAVRVDNKLSRKTIGKIAGVGPETVKAWEKGRQNPQTKHVFQMAQTIPSVKRWALRQLGVDEMPEFMSHQVMAAMIAAMHQVAQQPGPDGDAIRHALYGAKRP